MIIVINTDNNSFVGRFQSVEVAEAATQNAKYNPYFVGNQKDLQQFTITALATIYNSMVPVDQHVKKFSDKGVALDRVWSKFKTAEAPTKQLPKNAGRVKYNEGLKIHIISKENPRVKGKGEGTHGWRHFELYKEGETLADFLKKRENSGIPGTLTQHLYADIDRGYIELVQ